MSERVHIGQAVEAAIGSRQGARTDILVPNCAQVPGVKTRQIAAAAAGFNSHESYRRAKQVVATGTPELISAVDAGKVAISTAATVATLPKPEQAEIVAKGEKEILQAAKRIRAQKSEVKRAERIEVIAEISKGNAERS